MKGKRRRLPHFEALAQRLVEGSFNRLFGNGLPLGQLAGQLAQAMEESVRDGQVADQYRVALHPQTLQEILEAEAGVSRELGRYLDSLAEEGGWTMSQPATVTLLASEAVGRQDATVSAERGRKKAGSTQVYRRDAADDILRLLRAVDAYLIVEGKRHVPLDQPLITIGRRTDNDIVLDNSGVSRHHAQIRWRYGRFVVYDLGSRGGTMVNGQLVSESVLHPGDVIALASVPLIYGEGLDGERRPRRVLPPDDEEGHTLDLPPGQR
jgi:hypothetical protein